MKNGKLVRMDSTEELLLSVADKVRELPCDPEQLPELESRYKVGLCRNAACLLLLQPYSVRRYDNPQKGPLSSIRSAVRRAV